MAQGIKTLVEYYLGNTVLN